ncbi:MAG: OadG family transporter subunit [Gammaproteobacteria bacterium]|jgi:Na+-transporting methylmalonyl-CoA/oxaloacetate decarboxylase gamma subunit|tara:strand:+ start:357 stop:590 length:234 start_codon:yes stop_codon:yes gene_type:complete
MGTESTLIESGINLLLTGMIVVFFFLLILILSIHLLKFFFSESSQQLTPSAPTHSTDPSVSKVHERIIKEVMEHRQS